jgi:hypothetical protein
MMNILFNKKLFTWIPEKYTLTLEHIPPVPLRYTYQTIWYWLGFVLFLEHNE